MCLCDLSVARTTETTKLRQQYEALWNECASVKNNLIGSKVCLLFMFLCMCTCIFLSLFALARILCVIFVLGTSSCSNRTDGGLTKPEIIAGAKTQRGQYVQNTHSCTYHNCTHTV